jgi:agmatinase
MSLDLSGLTRGSVALVGLPLDENSSYLRGPAHAPGRIRETLYSGASSDCSEDATVVLGGGRFFDTGDVALGSGTAAFEAIEAGIASVLERGACPLSLGGDHSVTFPIVRAMAAAHPELSILQFDAHPDLYETFDGNRFSHASPFARIMEAGLVRRLVQVGIRSINRHLLEQAERFGVEMVMMRDLTSDLRFTFDQALYVSIDLDALDPAFAPGVGHHEPGGLSVRDLLRILERSRGRVVGADIVEMNPLRDVAGTTAALGAKLVRELAARMLREGAPASA